MGGNVFDGEKLPKSLAKHYTNVMWLHDEEDFESLESEVTPLFQELGHGVDESSHAAGHVAEAYRFADRAADAQLEGDEELENHEYGNALRELEEVEKVLGREVSVARHQVEWWRAFRHRRWVSAALHIFRQHEAPLGLNGVVVAVRLTHALARIGVAHNRRDREAATKWGTMYWRLALDNYDSQRLPFLG